MEGNVSVALVSSEDCDRLLGKSFCWVESSGGALQSVAIWVWISPIFVSGQSQCRVSGEDSSFSEGSASSKDITFEALFTHGATCILFKEFKLQSEYTDASSESPS